MDARKDMEPAPAEPSRAASEAERWLRVPPTAQPASFLYPQEIEGQDSPGAASGESPRTEPIPYYHENIYRKWGFSFGGAALASFHTKLQVSSPVLVGAILDLEDLLGVDSKSFVGRVDGYYNFNRRHGIHAAYYDIRRSGVRTVLEDVEIGDTVIPAGEIETTFNTKIFKIAYRYNFVTDYRTTIGVSAGLHTMGLDTALRATAAGVDKQEDVKVVAPLPLLGLHAAYALSDKWRMTAGVETLRVKLDSLEGFVVDSYFNLEHDTFEHLGWGIGFNTFTLNMSVSPSDSALTADINYGYSGLMLYVRSYF